MEWSILDTGIGTAEQNMAYDQKLLHELAVAEKPTVHFYRWAAPSVTHGYFLKPEHHLSSEGMCVLQVARRPTGGGFVFHVGDFAFSLLLPATSSLFSLNTLANYAFVNRLVARVIHCFSGGVSFPELLACSKCPDQAAEPFCMANPVAYDLILNGKKIGGGAQRKTRYGFLHQGTISFVATPIEFFNRVLKHPDEVIKAMQLHGGVLPYHGLLEQAKARFQEIFIQILSQRDRGRET